MTLLSLLVACSDPSRPEGVDDTAVAPDAPSVDAAPVPVRGTAPLPQSTADTGGSEIEPGLFGACEPLAEDAPPVPNARLVGTYRPTSETTPFASRVFTSVDSYAQFLANLGIVGAYIDFRVEHAAIFGYGGTGSCGFDLDGWEAVDNGGIPSVVVRVDDGSRGCDADCADTVPSTVWVIAFPAAASPDTCLVVGGGCATLP